MDEQDFTEGLDNYEGLSELFQKVFIEIDNAGKVHDGFNSTHEWYGVLKEEFDELWDEIKRNKNCYELSFAMEKEAIQVAAMALKGILSIQCNYHRK